MLKDSSPMSKQDPEKRSIELLKDIAQGNDWLEVQFSLPNYISMKINGESRRWYHASARVRDENMFSPFETEIWHIEVRGASNKSDLIKNNKYNADICINTNGQGNKMPIGDRLAALALSLRNDRRTAMSVPLLAQFLVCKRDFLQEVIVFQEEGIMTEIEIDSQAEYYQSIENERYEEEVNGEQEQYICENPPFSNFDEHYLDQPNIDEQIWHDWQNRLEKAKQELDLPNNLDIDDIVHTWERQDDKRHEDKKD